MRFVSPFSMLNQTVIMNHSKPGQAPERETAKTQPQSRRPLIAIIWYATRFDCSQCAPYASTFTQAHGTGFAHFVPLWNSTFISLVRWGCGVRLRFCEKAADSCSSFKIFWKLFTSSCMREAAEISRRGTTILLDSNLSEGIESFFNSSSEVQDQQRHITGLYYIKINTLTFPQ